MANPINPIDDLNTNNDGQPSKDSSSSRPIPRSPKATTENPIRKKPKTTKPEETNFLQRAMASRAEEPEVQEEVVQEEQKGIFDNFFNPDAKKAEAQPEQSFFDRLLGKEKPVEEDVKEEPKGMFSGIFGPKEEPKEEETTTKENNVNKVSSQPEPTNQDKQPQESSKPESKDDNKQPAQDSRDQVENKKDTKEPKYQPRTEQYDSRESDVISDNDSNIESTTETSQEGPKYQPSKASPTTDQILEQTQDVSQQAQPNQQTAQAPSSMASASKARVGSLGDRLKKFQNESQSEAQNPANNRDRFASGGTKRTTTNITMEFETTTKKKPFNPRRDAVRSTKRQEKIKDKGGNPLKYGLIALAAAIALNSNAAPALGSTEGSSIFRTPVEEVNNQAKPATYYETNESKPIMSDTGDDRFGVDEIGYNEDGSLSQDVNKGYKGKDGEEKTKDQQTQQQSQSQPQVKNKSTTSKSPTSTTATGPIPYLPTSAGAGQYQDGQLSVPLMENTGFESGKAKASTNQPPQQTPEQSKQSPAQAPKAPIPQSPQKANMSAGGKKKLDVQKLFAAIIKPWLGQGIITFLILFAILSGLFGALMFGVFKVGSIFCTSTEFVRELPGLRDTEVGKYANKFCETLKALTGIGCGSLDATSSTGIGCVGKLLEVPGDQINLSGPNGTTPVKKSCIQEIISSGKQAGVKAFTIRFAISIHPIESVGDCFKAVNPFGCYGLAQFCPGSYEEAIVGAGVTSKQDFLDNPSKQMKAIDTFLDIKRGQIKNALNCVKEHFRGKTEQYQLAYMWLTGDCPGTVDANGFRNDKYGPIADSNFKATDCNEFKEKLSSNDQTNYWAAWGVSKVQLSPTAMAQDANSKVADKELQDRVLALISEGKINYALGAKENYIADIRGYDTPQYAGNFGSVPYYKNGPLHENTAKMMILLAEKFPGWVMTSLGNATHHYSGGYHNLTPIQAIDIGAVTANGPSTQDEETGLVNKVLQVLYDSKIVKNIGLPPSDIARLDQNLVNKLQAFTDGDGHIHVSILGSGVLGSSIGDGTTSECEFKTTQVADKQDKQDVNARLNKNSLTETEWNSLQKKFGRNFTQEQFLRIGDDATFGAAKKRVLFNNQAVSDRIYKFAVEKGYKERMDASVGDLKGADGYQMRQTAKNALDQLAIAAKKDGYEIELKSGYRSSDDQKKIFEDKLQELCNQKFNTDCTIADLAAGKHDDLILQRLTKSSVPGYSKHHTGLAADVGEPNQGALENITNTKLYKWMIDDNYFNLKRFGFIPSYPDGGKNMGPFPEPWEILYVGPLQLQNNIVEN